MCFLATVESLLARKPGLKLYKLHSISTSKVMVSNISPDTTRIYQYETDLGRTTIANNYRQQRSDAGVMMQVVNALMVKDLT